MSPSSSSSYYDEYDINLYNFSNNDGSLFDSWWGNYTVRPSISLVSGFVLMGNGTGTGDSPYVVE